MRLNFSNYISSFIINFYFVYFELCDLLDIERDLSRFFYLHSAQRTRNQFNFINQISTSIDKNRHQ